MAVANRSSFTLLVLVLVATTSLFCVEMSGAEYDVATQFKEPRPEFPLTSPGGYRQYIVKITSTPAAADGVDRAAQLGAWHLSFLPGNLTGEGEPRLRMSSEWNMFTALLTDEEAKVVAQKPGVLRVRLNRIAYPHARSGIGL